MEVLSKLEDAVERLISKNRGLEQDVRRLEQEKAAWQQERTELVAEIDRILQRIEALPQEDS